MTSAGIASLCCITLVSGEPGRCPRDQEQWIVNHGLVKVLNKGSSVLKMCYSSKSRTAL